MSSGDRRRRVHLPLASYRLQFSGRFRFRDARALVPYFHELGISHLYTSCLFRTRPGSAHGYDVTNCAQLNPELGTPREFDALARELKRRGMGILLDIVPNHMVASTENAWWMDVLESGPASPYARFFDIDWRPTDASQRLLTNKVLLPILGAPYERVLENEELSVGLGPDGFFVRYGASQGMQLPLALASYRRILTHGLQTRGPALGRNHPAFLAVSGLLRAIARATRGGQQDSARKKLIQRKLWHLYQTRPEVRRFLDANLRTWNGKRGNRRSFARLHELLSEQAYVLWFWRTGVEEINYRRFFNINDLICLRAEDARVFEATHALILKLAKEGKIEGVRVDHVDGLRDPWKYLRRLQDRLGCARPTARHPFYVVVEKILTGQENLRENWPVHGTTGYDFLNLLNATFVDAAGLKALGAIYENFTGLHKTFEEVVHEKKKLVMQQMFRSEMRALVHELRDIARGEGRAHTFSRKQIHRALAQVMACFPVYRTYIRSSGVSPEDGHVVEQAIQQARRRDPASRSVFEFLRRVLLLEPRPRKLGAKHLQAKLKFVMRWQQFTGPITAKGFEDTALYVYNRLISLNEVGSHARIAGLSLADFHGHLRARQRHWPHALNATSTHDTKRSEDVRARINVLAELPEEWRSCLDRWSRWNQSKKHVVNGRRAPDRNDEILLYQTLLGAWPFAHEEIPAFGERLQAYMLKACREARVHTSWVQPNPAYEEAVHGFVESLLKVSSANTFLEDFLRFQKKIAACGAWGALSQVLLKIAASGVPDFYQGTELWDFSLVDPDNRRPVDFGQRAKLLEDLEKKKSRGALQLAREVLAHWPDGRIKFYVTWKALNFRRSRSDLFLEGDYVPLEATTKKGNVCAFARRKGKAWALAAAPRLLARLVDADQPPVGTDVWRQSALILPGHAPRRWENVFTGERLHVAQAGRTRVLHLRDVFLNFPVALLGGPA